MEKTLLGRTGLSVTRTSFGALPVQRTALDEAKKILRKAYDSGINFFDTARGYTDSEEKIGHALSDVRKNIIIATKTMSKNRLEFFQHLETSLKNLKTDYIDLYQLHFVRELPDINVKDNLYECLLEAKTKGMIRFFGITSHRLQVAFDAVDYGLYDTVQYPLNYLSTDKELKLIDKCKNNNIGLIAMKALSGGLITNAAVSFAFLRQFENVVPIWGIQKESELDEFIALDKNPPLLNDKMKAVISKDREELSGKFCRGCGYCMPCPAGIQINNAARMSLFLRRAPLTNWINEEWHKNMEKITECTECGQCRKRCPYELNTPELLKENLIDYRVFYEKYNGKL